MVVRMLPVSLGTTLDRSVGRADRFGVASMNSARERDQVKIGNARR
jgi:hypothetical protein